MKKEKKFNLPEAEIIDLKSNDIICESDTDMGSIWDIDVPVKP